MIETFLLGTTLVFGVLCIILGALTVETRTNAGRRWLGRWRVAFTKRRQLQEALRKASRAKQRADMRKQDADTAIAQAKTYCDQADQQVKVGQAKAQAVKDEARRRVATMGSYIIAEQCGEHIKGVRMNNYHAKEKKILKSVEVAARNGYKLPADEKQQLLRMLKQAHADAARIEAERERQAEIKARMRDEEKAQREAERTIREAEKEAKLKARALKEAMKLLGNVHSEEIEKLKAELAEAEARASRAQSMAQQTRSGFIYVISNIGSFGSNVFKVGMTRRLEPMDRVRELGDASVPFSFDVHAMISCEDAPTLEANLHRELNHCRVNRVNLRKEFFRVPLEQIITAVEKHHGHIEHVADAEALEYLESEALANETDTLDERLDRQLASGVTNDDDD